MEKDTQEYYCKKPVEEVNVKISICPFCQGIIRAAIEHMMDKKMMKDFGSEVIKYNLSVKTISLVDYREKRPEWCNCKEIKQD